MESGDASQNTLQRNGSRARLRIDDARAAAPACQKTSNLSEADPRQHRTSGSAVSWLRGCRASTDMTNEDPDIPPPPPPPGQSSDYAPASRASSKSSAKQDVPPALPPPPKAPRTDGKEDLVAAPPPPPPQPPKAPPPAPQSRPPAFGSDDIDDLLNSTVDSIFTRPPPPSEDPPSLGQAPSGAGFAPSLPSDNEPSRQPSKEFKNDPSEVPRSRVASNNHAPQVSTTQAPDGKSRSGGSKEKGSVNLADRSQTGSKEKGSVNSADRSQTLGSNADCLSKVQAVLGRSSVDGVSRALHPEEVTTLIVALQEGNIEQNSIVEVCDTLETAVLNSETCMSAVTRAGGAGVFVKLMQQYSYYADIQVSTCRVLQHLVATNSAIAEAAVNAGFFQAASEAMQRFSTDADVHSAAIPVIELVACHCPGLRARGAAAGLVEALVAAMKYHLEEVEVQRAACAALQVLIAPVAGSSGGMVSKAYDAGAVNAAISSINHNSDPALKYWVGLLLRGIASDSNPQMKSQVLSTLHWQGIQVAGLG